MPEFAAGLVVGRTCVCFDFESSVHRSQMQVQMQRRTTVVSGLSTHALASQQYTALKRVSEECSA